MTAPRMFLASLKKIKTSFGVKGMVCVSPALVLAKMKSFSFSVSQIASLGKSARKKNEIMPIRVVTIPSRIKIHLQLASPRMPSMWEMPVASKLPKAPAKITDDQYTVNRFCISVGPYQKLITYKPEKSVNASYSLPQQRYLLPGNTPASAKPRRKRVVRRPP